MNTMSTQHVIQRLAQLPAPDETKIADLLGVELVQDEEDSHTRFLEAVSAPEPYDRVELRLGKQDPDGLLVLHVAEDQSIAHDALILPEYGEPTDIDVNPHVPPEGEETESYTVGVVELSFAATATSHQLLYVALQWGD